MARINLDQIFIGRLTDLLDLFNNTLNVQAVFLFGSHVDGYATPTSDVDLAVLYDTPPSLLEELKFPSSISMLVKNDRVDVLCLNRASIVLRHRACGGLLLYERDSNRVSDFIENTIRYYIDFLPDLLSYYQDYDLALEEAYGI